MYLIDKFVQPAMLVGFFIVQFQLALCPKQILRCEQPTMGQHAVSAGSVPSGIHKYKLQFLHLPVCLFFYLLVFSIFLFVCLFVVVVFVVCVGVCCCCCFVLKIAFAVDRT